MAEHTEITGEQPILYGSAAWVNDLMEDPGKEDLRQAVLALVGYLVPDEGDPSESPEYLLMNIPTSDLADFLVAAALMASTVEGDLRKLTTVPRGENLGGIMARLIVSGLAAREAEEWAIMCQMTELIAEEVKNRAAVNESADRRTV